MRTSCSQSEIKHVSLANKVVVELVHPFSCALSSYGCTWEVWRALKKLELLSVAPRATLTLLSCSPNFPRASITRYTHAKHEPILKCSMGINPDLMKLGAHGDLG